MKEVQEKTYTVFELNNEIKQVVEGSFPALIWVQGETAGFDKQKNNIHVYFQLQEKHPDKDEVISVIPATLFNSDLRKVRQKLQEANVGGDIKDGIEIRVLCKIDVYPPQGKYSLIIRDIDPAFTLGKLAQSREAIINYLKSKGLLERNKRIPLPLVPLAIGLITQVNTEGYNDFLSKLQESGFAFKVKFYNSSMQGKKVEPEVSTALDYFSQQGGVDVVVITRGGGAKTDLSWFDNKKIAEKIALLNTPVLTGIGHKTDFTICDMVAFSSQQTPSAMATFLVKQVENFLQKIENLSKEIVYGTEDYLKFTQQRLKETRNQVGRESLLFLQYNKERLDRTRVDIPSYCRDLFRNIKDTIDNYKSNIDILDPINTLQRGFSITRIRGEAIKSVNKVKKGQDMLTTVSDGSIKSTVKVTIKK